MLLSWHVFVVRMMCLCCFHLSIMHFGHALPVTSVLQPIHFDIMCVCLSLDSAYDGNVAFV